MDLNIQQLSESGAFSGAPVKKEVSWTISGKTHKATVHVRKLSYHSVVGEVDAWRLGKDAMAARIAACIVDKDGKPILSIGDITGEADPKRGALDADLTKALLVLIGQVNDMGKTTAPETSTNSGAS